MATNVKRKKKAEVMEDDGSMTLTGHLKELEQADHLRGGVCGFRGHHPDVCGPPH